MKLTIRQLKHMIKEQVEEGFADDLATERDHNRAFGSKFGKMSNEELVDELIRLGSESEGGYERDFDEVDADIDACKVETLNRMR